MLTAYFDALRECFSRRAGLVLLGVAALAATLFCLVVKVRTLPNGATAVSLGTLPVAPSAFAVPSVLVSVSDASGVLWILLAIFATAPVLTSILEKGWLELLFSKATPRWRILVGRVGGCLTLYAMTFAIATGPLALKLWLKTGVATWPILVALLLETLSFAALLGVASLATLTQKGVALPIVGAVAIWFLSPLLAHREQWYYPLVRPGFGRALIDWAYRLLPKVSELQSLSDAFVRDRMISSWWPVWSTATFTIALFALAIVLLQRKSL